MVLDWEPMVLEYVPEAKMAVTMAKLASERAKGVSPQERALRQCEGRIQQYWDLMRRHSSIEDGVEYRAYEQMHLRISKSLSNSFKAQQALEISRKDWKSDSVMNTGKKDTGRKKTERSAIDDVKNRFRAASYKLGASDWLKLFNDYDKDGNGELDADEFAVAVRKFVPKSAMSDKELKMFFRSVDEDGGGTIDAVEFESFFFKGELNQRQFFGSMWELAEVWATDDAEEGAVKTFDPERDGAALCGFLQDIYDNITVTKVKQDDGTVVKVKGGDEMRGLQKLEDVEGEVFELEDVRDREEYFKELEAVKQLPMVAEQAREEAAVTIGAAGRGFL